MVFFLIVLGVLGALLFLPALIACAGIFIGIALIAGAFWLAFRVIAPGVWWGIAAAVLLALFCFFLWPVLLFI